MFFKKYTFLLALALYTHLSECALRGSSLEAFNSEETRRLEVTPIIGECTVANFELFVGMEALVEYLGGTTDTDEMQQILDTRCASALAPQTDLSDTTGKGPQFLKNYLDGGATWNDNYEENGSYVLSEDAAVIQSVYDTEAKTSVFATPDGGTSEHYPFYFSNFFKGDQECRLGVIECCYTNSRDASSPFQGNSEMCALDMTGAAQSNHIKARSMTYFNAESSNQAYCSGFAYEKDSFGDAVKYNTFFHMAMYNNLYDKGLVKNIPGAPLCGCIEQMPIVDNADCVKAIEGYTIDSEGQVGVNISWEDCGNDLATYYESLHRTDMEKFFVNSKVVGSGQCTDAALSFMNDHMLVPVPV